jgi:putative transcriptional regulator
MKTMDIDNANAREVKAFKAGVPSADAIRAAREGAGLTQPQACELVGVSLRAWQHWESGDRMMRPFYWETFVNKVGTNNEQS